jgi:hypothetical protein
MSEQQPEPDPMDGFVPTEEPEGEYAEEGDQDEDA